MVHMHDENEGNCRNADIELIKCVIRILAKRGVFLTTTRVQKFFYLFERQCIIDNGNRCFDLDYRYDEYGMYSPNLREILKHIDADKDHLVMKERIFEKGSGRVIGYIEGGEEDQLPEHVESAVARVMSEFGFLKTDALIERAKGTSPFIYAKKGDKINWDLLVAEQCEKGEELSEAGLARLEKAINSDDGLYFGTVDDVKSYLFS